MSGFRSLEEALYAMARSRSRLARGRRRDACTHSATTLFPDDIDPLLAPPEGDDEESRSHAPAGHRHDRLEHIVLEELLSILRDEVNDAALASLHLRRVELAADYASVRVHYTRPAGSRPAVRLERALERAAPFLRARLGEALGIKRTPRLRFVPTDAPIAQDTGTDDAMDGGER